MGARGYTSVSGPDAGREFLNGRETELLVQVNRAVVRRRDGEGSRCIPPRPERPDGGFHQQPAESPALIPRHDADLRCVAYPCSDARREDYPDQMVAMRRTGHEGGIRLELSATRQDDYVFQEAESAGLAAVLVVDFAVHMIRVGQLDQPRAGLEMAVVPAIQDQPRSWPFPDGA